MKKYFVFAIAAAAALASCTKTTSIETPDVAISFQAANHLSATKAESVKDAHNHTQLYTGDSFGVYSYFSPENWATDGSYSVYMNNVEVQYSNVGTADAPKSTWAPTTTYYWPKTGVLSFIGYHPYSTQIAAQSTGATVEIEDVAKDNTPKVKISNYTIPSTVTAQAALIDTATDKDNNDLMVADFIKDQDNNNTEGDKHFTDGVAMIFNHILAKVQVKASLKKLTASEADGATETVSNGLKYAATLDGIQIKKVSDKGTYSSSAWTVTTASADMASGDIYSTTPSAIGATSVANALSNKLTQKGIDYYVMPQTIPADAVLAVKYTIYVLDNAGKVISAKQHTQDITLKEIKNSSDAAITSWAKNTIYSYNLVISPVSNDPIYFDAAVVAWSTNIVASKEIELN